MLEKIVVVKKATQLEELLRRHSTISQAKFYLESRGDSFEQCQISHEIYHEGIRQILASIPKTARLQVLDRSHIETYQFGEKDLVVPLGDPGLVANVGKYVGHQPVLSINPDPEHFASTFAAGTPATFPYLLPRAMVGDLPIETLTLAEARLDNGQVLLGLNEIFIGKPDQTSALYALEYDGKKEKQSSSGLIAATGSGSTAWLSSIMTNAYKLAGVPIFDSLFSFPRDAPYLTFAVREAFMAPGMGDTLLHGQISRERPLRVTSLMAENGIIASDGITSDYLEFNRGRSATIMPSDKKVYLVKNQVVKNQKQ